jgi:small GTP-binding protein
MQSLGECELIIDESIVPDVLFKGILIGEAGVGKSCILHRIITNEFREDYDVTIGAEFSSIFAKIKDKTIKIQVWDTAGQENFRSMIRVFYKGSHAAFLVYDITKKETFERLEEWITDIRENALPEVKVMLVGNMKDQEESRQVSTEMATELCQRLQLTGFHETSAKSGEGIKEIFKDIAKSLYLTMGPTATPSATTPTPSTPGTKKLTTQSQSSSKSSGCC